MKTVNKPIFKHFGEFWHYTRSLNHEQRETIFQSLCTEEKSNLKKSYKQGGWEDVFFRDILDKFVDDMYEKYNINLIEIRCKVLSGKSVYLSKKAWDEIEKYINKFNDKHIAYLVSGLCVEIQNNECVAIVPFTEGV